MTQNKISKMAAHLMATAPSLDEKMDYLFQQVKEGHLTTAETLDVLRSAGVDLDTLIAYLDQNTSSSLRSLAEFEDEDDNDGYDEIRNRDDAAKSVRKFYASIVATSTPTLAIPIVAVIMRVSRLKFAGFTHFDVNLSVPGRVNANTRIPISDFTPERLIDEESPGFTLFIRSTEIDLSLTNVRFAGATMTFDSGHSDGQIRFTAVHAPDLTVIDEQHDEVFEMILEAEHVSTLTDALYDLEESPAVGSSNRKAMLELTNTLVDAMHERQTLVVRQGKLIEIIPPPYTLISAATDHIKIGRILIPLADLTMATVDDHSFIRYENDGEALYLTTRSPNSKAARIFLDLIDEMVSDHSQLAVTIDETTEIVDCDDILSNADLDEENLEPDDYLLLGDIHLDLGDIGTFGADFENNRFEGLLADGRLLTIEAAVID